MRKVFISGVSGGIGQATAKKFIENGDFVIGQYNRNEQGIADLKNYLCDIGLGNNFCAEKADFTNAEEVAEMLKRVNERFNGVDVIVNNAGASLYKLITDTTPLEWDDLFTINVKSAFLITNGFLKGMISSRLYLLGACKHNLIKWSKQQGSIPPLLAITIY